MACKVRTFVNNALYDSLKSGPAAHPNGSIAVKELLTDGARIGWAVDRKRDDGSWEFFEGFEPTLDQYYFEGTSNFCAGCHRDGIDFVLVPARSIRFFVTVEPHDDATIIVLPRCVGLTDSHHATMDFALRHQPSPNVLHVTGATRSPTAPEACCRP